MTHFQSKNCRLSKRTTGFPFSRFSRCRSNMSYQQIDASASHEWTTSLCGCSEDCGSTFDIVICPYCAVCRQMEAVDGKSDGCHLGACAAILFLGPPAALILNFLNRRNISEKYGIGENVCVSCIIAFMFTSCGLCQQHRELTNRGVWPGSEFCGQPPPDYAPTSPVVGMGQ